MFNSSKISGSVMAIVAIVLSVLLLPIQYEQVANTSAQAKYEHGDTNLNDFSTTTVPAGSIETSTTTDGVYTVDCNNTTVASRSSLCGNDRFTAVSSILNILPLILAAGALALGAYWIVNQQRGTMMSNTGLMSGIIGGVITVLVSLILVPITFDPLTDAIVSAGTSFSAATPLLKLVPLMLIVGSLATAITFTAFLGRHGRSTGSKSSSMGAM